MFKESMPDFANEEVNAAEYENSRANTEMNAEELAEMKRKQDENMAQKGKGREPFQYPSGYKGI